MFVRNRFNAMNQANCKYETLIMMKFSIKKKMVIYRIENIYIEKNWKRYLIKSLTLYFIVR